MFENQLVLSNQIVMLKAYKVLSAVEYVQRRANFSIATASLRLYMLTSRNSAGSPTNWRRLDFASKDQKTAA